MEAETPGQGDGAASASTPGQTDGVQEVLESMLSKKNLVRDQFLASSMNPQMYIHVHVLLDHERLKAVGATEESIVAAAIRSAKLGIDEKQTMVRPLLKSKRNVVILRELPLETTEAELREFLSGAPHADRLQEVKAEVNNTWFLKFKLDDGTQDVVLWLRSQLFKGLPVNAAIKSEHFLRSFFPLHMATAGAGVPPSQLGYDFGGRPLDGMAEAYMGSWAAESAEMGMGMPMPPFGMGMMPPPPPALSQGPQLPGYWEPWGARHQPQPLLFSSSTTLAGGFSMPVVSEQAGHIGEEVFDNLDDEGFKGGKGKGKGKGGKAKAGKDMGAQGWQGGKGWESKGWQGGKDMGAQGWQGGKGWQDSGWQGGGGGSDWYSQSQGGKDPYGGKAGCGIADWYSQSQGGKDAYGGKASGPSWTEQPRRKGEGKAAEKGESAEKGAKGGGKAEKWTPKVPKGAGKAGPAEVSSAQSVPVVQRPPPTYESENFRKYTREFFERVCEAMKGEEPKTPEALATLGVELPILREVPSIDLSS
mmetsp:Transcript_145501/g.464992  ORF Transcript_145501/g.464992 Transcript_145501/m.464992 type:complete len:531 (-) Transcript_145501:102-1694(-)